MSFNANDNNPGIHLGNYEEYFILYMDNELNEEQKQMVNAFLLAHPDLQAELELLLSTRLPAEDISLDKDALWSHSMKLNTADEELLLYIDNELPADRKKVIELELASNAAFQLQHQALQQTQLDASEIIPYPHKEELYRRTGRVFGFKPWMRIAAAVVLVAATGIFYFTNKTMTPGQAPVLAQGSRYRVQDTGLKVQGTPPVQQPTTIQEPVTQTETASIPTATTTPSRARRVEEEAVRRPEVNKKVQETLAANTVSPEDDAALMRPGVEKQTTVLNTTASVDVQAASFDPSKDILNNSSVTSGLAPRNTVYITEPSVPKSDVASSNKGSFKGFLRKATRVISRKTGIDPTTNDGDELLIGAVALKLN